MALLTLVAPFLWLEVDPRCVEPEDAGVPDVWILGGYILGKWIFWWGILFAWIGQTLGILLYLVLVRWANRFRTKQWCILAFLIPAGALLALFPFWMELYTEGVIDNSDEVCFFTHYSIGWILYAAIVCLTAWLIVHTIVRLIRTVLA